MFNLTIDNEKLHIPVIDIEDLDQISKVYNFEFSNRNYNLCNYFQIIKDDLYFEVKFCECLTIEEKLNAFSFISHMVNVYKINLVGIGINIKVHPDLQKRLGSVYNLRLVYKTPVDIWNYRPDVKMVSIQNVPSSTCKSLVKIHDNVEVNMATDFVVLKIPTEWVCSLLLAKPA